MLRPRFFFFNFALNRRDLCHTINMAKIPVSSDLLNQVAYANYYSPHSILGPHSDGSDVTVRTVRHMADSVTIVTEHGDFPAEHEQDGVWVAVIPGSEVGDYRVRVRYGDNEVLADDPYRFLPTLGEMDTYLISEGRHERLWDVLGSHLRHYDGPMGAVDGTAFAVWAPNAQAVRVVGDFNFWDGSASAMRSLGASGVWELFIPDVGVGARYKYEIKGPDGGWHQKADPMARATEIPPATASVVTDKFHEWNDAAWMERRAANAESHPIHTQPLSVYEVHVGSWREGYGYRDLAQHLVPYVKEMGFTHVEFMPVAEHPYGPSWGYQCTSYYAPTARYGTPDDFRYLVDQLHQAGIGVILDWVPAHFPKDDWALAGFDGTALYEDPDPQRGQHPDWGTLVFNFGRREVKNFLVANALYWMQEFHIDGLRVDAVASMLYLDYSRKEGQWHPNVYGGRENLEAIALLQEVCATCYRVCPGTTMIAEESTAWPGVTAPTSGGGLGFGFKWNMGWMNDTLRYFAEDPVNRKWHHNELTFSLVYAFSENFMLPLSHDEVVHGKGSILSKMPGDYWRQLAGLRLLLGYQWTHPGKQLIFMGTEFGQGGEWNSGASLDWWHLDSPQHQGIRRLVTDLNRLYASDPALWCDDYRGFEWIDASDGDHNLLTYIRKADPDQSGFVPGVLADGFGGAPSDVLPVVSAGCGDGCGCHEVPSGNPGGGDTAVNPGGVSVAASDSCGLLAVVANFSGNPHDPFRVGLPFAGEWDEVLNSDAEIYGGSGVGNMGKVLAEDIPWNGRPASASLRIPPLGVLILRPSAGNPNRPR
ncbi:1,4-alpha-glucan branching enzyme GlgB [Mobiluncus mulieris]|uniref:1,4-alpha-glucan branching enzyme GlgB n=2 Tax=Mobiluncus mulieris TaxID=2052 RepID=A0A8G2HUX3_9ACTO|nr:1,4-alpha-glucan branching enzyme GlgB [Mobiluncus mulieris]